MTINSTSLQATGAHVTSRATSRLMGVAILIALLGAPLVLDNYYLHAVIISMIFLLPAHGLNLIVGYMGMLSLAQGAFFGIGSYVSALAAMHFGTPFYVNFILAGLVTGLIALPLGIPALRLRTYSFVMCTLGLVVIGEAVAKNWVGLTRGDMGLSGVPQPVLGFGASLYAHYLTTVSPLTFQMFYSTTILIIVLGGGAGSIRGVVVGSIVFVAVSEALRISPEYRMVMYGLMLLLLVFWLPNGLTPLIDRGLAMLSGART